MHEVRLALGQHLHLGEGLLVDLAIRSLLWCFEPMNDSFGVLVSSFLEVSLYHFGIIRLKTVRLELKLVIKVV